MSNFHPARIFLIVSFLVSANAGAADSCSDAKLREQLKPEMDIAKAEAACALSARMPENQVEIKDKDGKSRSVSCCAALRLQMFEASRAQIEAKQQACEQVRADSSQANCGSSAECLKNNIRLMESAEAMHKRLADQAREAGRISRACKPVLDRVSQKVTRDMGLIAKGRKTASTAQKAVFENSPTLEIAR